MSNIYIIGPLARQFAQIRSQVPENLRKKFDQHVFFLDKNKRNQGSPADSVVILMAAFIDHKTEQFYKGEKSKGRTLIVRGRGTSHIAEAVIAELNRLP